MNFSLLYKSEVSVTLRNMGFGNSRNARKNTGVFQIKLYNINIADPPDQQSYLQKHWGISPLPYIGHKNGVFP